MKSKKVEPPNSLPEEIPAESKNLLNGTKPRSSVSKLLFRYQSVHTGQSKPIKQQQKLHLKWESEWGKEQGEMGPFPSYIFRRR